MTTYYTTADKVISKLRLYDPSTGSRWADSTTSEPTTSEIETWINEAEDYIDKATGHAWRTTTSSIEYHDVHGHWNEFEDDELAVNLHHRNVRDINENESDSIEIWDGDSWVDLASTASYTEGRANDYWVNYTDGILYLCDQRPYRRHQSVRVTYRYGDTSVPSDIQDATTKLAALNILESDIYNQRLPTGEDITPRMNYIKDKWREDVDRIIRNRTEMVITR